MRTGRLLVAALIALGSRSGALAQVPLPADWEQKVATAVPEPERARKVAVLGRRFDESWRASLETAAAARAGLRTAFLSRDTTAGNRQASLTIFRTKRRKATLSAVDALLEVRALVSKKEWKALWPEGYFAPTPAEPPLAEQVKAALPAVVSDPARLKRTDEVAAALVKAASGNVASQSKARGNLERSFEDYDTPRDEFIELVDALDASQERRDAALIRGAGELQQLLSAEEWTALGQRLAPLP